MGTKRTSRTDLAMSVDRGRPEVAFRGRQDRLDPQRTSGLQPTRTAMTSRVILPLGTIASSAPRYVFARTQLLLGVGESRFEHFANRLPRAAVELN
jgi:hypothetical protein